MRDIAVELLGAQKGIRDLRPALSVRAREWRFGLMVPWWERLCDNSDAEYLHDADVAADGSIIRARYNAGTGYVNRCRVTDPAVAAQWSNWAGTYTAAGVKPAVICDPQSGYVCIVYVGTTGRGLRCVESTDYGATWGSSYLAYSEPSGLITGVAGCMRSSGAQQVVVFYTYDPGGSGADDVIKVIIKSSPSGTWGTPAAWTYPARYAFYGLDAFWYGDFGLVVAGRDMASPYNYRLWTLVYGDGVDYSPGVWGGMAAIEASDDTNFRYLYPSVVQAADEVRLVYLEYWAGSGSYRRAMLMAHEPTTSFPDPYWTDGAPFGYEPASDVGAVLANLPGSSNLYLVGHHRAWLAELVDEYVDISSRVLSYRYIEEENGGSLTLVLDNEDGALSGAGVAGSEFRALRRGCELVVGRGLYVAGVAYTADLPACVIDSLEWVDEKGVGRVIVKCLDWIGVLRAWRAGRLFDWLAGSSTVDAIGNTLLARVGLSWASQSGEGSSQMGALQPAFSVLPGMDGWTALRRLVAKVPDVLRFDGFSTILYKELRPDEAADYLVGGTDEHPFIMASFVEGTPAMNLAEVYGAMDPVYPRFGHAVDYEEVALVGLRRRKIQDGGQATATDCIVRAGGELEKAVVDARAGEMVLRPIHGLELWDVLGVTYLRGWSGVRKYRVVRIEERLNFMRAGEYEQRIGIVRI